MIDPKFNELPVEDDLTVTEEERLRNQARMTVAAGSTTGRGLSINDTIARDANLSVGGRGVDVSGVSAGAGAGAGSTMLTPTPNESAAPEVVPGPGSTGMTPLGDAPAGQTSTDRTRRDLAGTYEEEEALKD